MLDPFVYQLCSPLILFRLCSACAQRTWRAPLARQRPSTGGSVLAPLWRIWGALCCSCRFFVTWMIILDQTGSLFLLAPAWFAVAVSVPFEA